MCRERSQQARKSRAPAGWRARGACWEIFAASGGRSITPADSDWDEAENFKRASEWQLQPVTDSPAETRDSWRDGEDPVKEAGDPARMAGSPKPPREVGKFCTRVLSWFQSGRASVALMAARLNPFLRHRFREFSKAEGLFLEL